MDRTTEASDVAHFATFWAAIAVMLGREIHMWSGDHVFPNEYIAFFGSSDDKKTTAQRRILSCNLLDRDPEIQIIQSAGSTEGLADRLTSSHGKPHLFLWEELSSVLSMAGWSGSTLREFLVETYDCPPAFRREYRKQKIEIETPTPTVLTATTPEWFWRHATPEDFFGGLANRVVFLTGQNKDAIPDPDEIDGVKIALIKQQLATRFGALAQNPRKRGYWTAQAQQRWWTFYRRFRKPDGLLGAALKRTHAHVRKLALVYAFIEGTFPEVTDEQLQAAIAVNVYAAHCTKQLVDLRVPNAASQDRREMETKIMDYVRRNPTVPLRRVQQRICQRAGDSESFARVIRSLNETDQIRISQDGKRKMVTLSE
jgi:hypothetical protein